ncbi:phage tail tape measure protein [Campylobacter sp. FMV-PI01]|uniref:Phage tail tape measure protein n=1 Tax=Campylobacter portucalensis TaxID=2608384 RepID=A0A6L5WHH9_9BACT|nr:phage tail tape measure protein [Campylobacter portucalensis]MSN96346.1 phage tail tape measure protein [Campylobacter portucalensis]
MAKNATLTFEVDLSQLNTALNRINRETSTLNQSLSRGLEDAMQAYKNGVSKLSIKGLSFEQKEKTFKELDELKKKIKTTQKAKLDLDISDANKRLKSLAGNIIATVGVVKGITVPISTAIDFEESMADVKKVVDFDSNKELKEFSGEIVKLSRVIPMSANELASITAAGGQLGIAKSQLIEFTNVAAKMGVAFDTSAHQAGDSMGKLMNIFNMDIAGVTKLGDAINHLSDNSAAKASEVVEVLKRIGGASQTVRLTAQEAAALSAAFLSLGKTPELAATSSKTLLLQLKNISSLGDKAENAIAELGLTTTELEKQMNIDPQKTIIGFLEAVKNMPNQDKQLQILTDLFGRGFSADIALLVNGLDTYKDTLANVSDEAIYLNSMTKEFQNKSATTANNIQLLKNNISEIGINVGNVFLPALNRVVKVIQKVSQGIASFASNFPNLTKAIAIAITSVISLNIALLSIKMAGPLATIGLSSFRAMLLKLPIDVLSFKKSFLGLDFTNIGLNATLALATIKKSFSGMALGVIASIKSINLAFLTNPITLIALTIAAVAYIVYRNWDKLKSFFSGFFKGLSQGLEPTITAFKNTFSGLSNIFNFLKEKLISFFSIFARSDESREKLAQLEAKGVSFGQVVGGVINMLLYPFRALDNIITAIGLSIDIIKLKGKEWGEALSNTALNVVNDIKAFFEPLFNWLDGKFGWVRNMTNKITSGVKGFFGFGNKEPTTQTTQGDLNKLIAGSQIYQSDNHTTKQINDDRIININMYGSSASPQEVAKFIDKNSYYLGGD